MHTGVNRELQKIGLRNLKVLAPKTDTLTKLVVYSERSIPTNVLQALPLHGAGQIGEYRTATFKRKEPEHFMHRPETRIRTPVNSINRNGFRKTGPRWSFHSPGRTNYWGFEIVIRMRNLPIISRVSNIDQEVGLGMVGELASRGTMISKAFKAAAWNLTAIRHTRLLDRKVKKLQFDGGSGSFAPQGHPFRGRFLFDGRLKYHGILRCRGRITITDIGRTTKANFHEKELLGEILNKISLCSGQFSATDESCTILLN